MPHPSQSSNWRASSAPSRGNSPPAPTPNRTYASPPRSSTPRRQMDGNWRDRSPPSSDGGSTRSPSPSPSVSSTNSEAYSTSTDKRNAPFADRPFDVLTFDNFSPYHLNDAEKAEDFEQQLAFAHDRIKRRGNPRCGANRAVQARIHDWWHASPGDEVPHLTIEYINDKDGVLDHKDRGGAIYCRLHVYRTDEEELASALKQL